MKPKKKWEIAPLGDKEKEDLIKTVSKYGYGIIKDDFIGDFTNTKGIGAYGKELTEDILLDAAKKLGFSEVPKMMDIHDVYMQLIELIHSIPENRLRTIKVDIDNDLYAGQTITVVIKLGPQ